MSDAQKNELREYLKRAVEHAQANLDNYSGDHAGKLDLSRQVGNLWNQYHAAGGNWADLSHVKAKRRKK
jgi:hypothetical protein